MAAADLASPRWKQIDRVVNALVDGEETFRIVLFGVRALMWRRAAAGDIAQRVEPGAGLGILVASIGRPGRLQIPQPHLEHAASVPVLVNQIQLLARIAGQIVELRQRQLDQLVVSDDDAGEGRPPSIERRRQRLEVRGDGLWIRRGCQKRPPWQRRLRRATQRIEDGRQDVDVPDRVVRDDSRLPRMAAADLRHDEGDPERRLVGEESVRLLAVVAERLAMIAGDDHQCRPVRPAAHSFEQRRERRVGGCDLASVGIAGVARRERLRRSIRRVRIEHMDPREPAPRLPPDPSGARRRTTAVAGRSEISKSLGSVVSRKFSS